MCECLLCVLRLLDPFISTTHIIITYETQTLCLMYALSQAPTTSTQTKHKHSSVVTIALTLGVVYGLAVMVYQHGGLDALGVRSLSQVTSY